MKKFALVLGGGASKGFAHVGVLKVLEQNGLKPDLIVGTSMGALVGAMYAIGTPVEDLEKMALNFNSLGNFSIINTLFKDNILNVDNVKKIIDSKFKDITFEQTNPEFVAIATELNTGKEFAFKKGLLKDGVMASISIPGVFPRIKLRDNLYCDGGIVNNLPEDVARKLLPDAFILSVDVIGDYAKQYENIKMKAIESLLNASTLMTTNIVKNKPQYADLRLTISMPGVSQMDFKKTTTEKTIKKGENYAKRHLKTIKDALK